MRVAGAVIYDHVGFKGAYARTNLSFHYLGDFWNDRISSLIVVSGVWRFYRDEYYKGDHWDLGPGFLRMFLHRQRPGRRDQLLPGDRADVRPIQIGSSALVVRNHELVPAMLYEKTFSPVIANFSPISR